MLVVLLPLLLLTHNVAAPVGTSQVGTDTSEIAFLDPERNEVGLADGAVFVAPAHWPFSDFEVGDSVSVTYEPEGGKSVAIRIILAVDADPEAPD